MKDFIFIPKDDNGRYVGGSEHCYFFLDAVAAVDVLTASKNDVKLVDTRTVHFA